MLFRVGVPVRVVNEFFVIADVPLVTDPVIPEAPVRVSFLGWFRLAGQKLLGPGVHWIRIQGGDGINSFKRTPRLLVTIDVPDKPEIPPQQVWVDFILPPDGSAANWIDTAPMRSEWSF